MVKDGTISNINCESTGTGVVNTVLGSLGGTGAVGLSLKMVLVWVVGSCM